jgi:alpha-L-rhamnosidase
LVTTGLGDHEALAKIGGSVLTTPMFIDSARRIARLVRLVGKKEDGERFDQMAAESALAWAGKFLDSSTGKVGGESQSEQVLALGFDAPPQAVRPAVFAQLVAQLNAPADGPRLTTGIYGTRLLLGELSRNGRSDLAYALANRKTFPSWGWMLENDATTLWEHWAGSDNTFSNNHPMFGSISEWFFQWLGGIQPASDAVGFDRILIRPQLVSGLEWVKCSHRSIRGPIESNWSVTSAASQFEIVIPPNTTAIVELPTGKGGKLTESAKAISESSDIKILTPAPGVHRLQVGSGRYVFSVQNEP